MPDSPTVATEEPEHGFEVHTRKPPGPHTLKLLAAPIIGLIVLSNVGDALGSRSSSTATRSSCWP